MVLFFTTTLLVSCVVLVLLIGVKRWELATGRVVGSAVRQPIHRISHTISLWIERILPTLVRMYGKILWRAVLGNIHKSAALMVVRAERMLEKTLYTLRHRTEIRRGMGQASVFLREVSEHKRKLLKREKVATTPNKE